MNEMDMFKTKRSMERPPDPEYLLRLVDACYCITIDDCESNMAKSILKDYMEKCGYNEYYTNLAQCLISNPYDFYYMYNRYLVDKHCILLGDVTIEQYEKGAQFTELLENYRVENVFSLMDTIKLKLHLA